MNEQNDMKELIEYLGSVRPGSIKEDREKLESAVSSCWGEFDGTEELDGYKLLHRTEDIRWQPPILSFVIERHGATVLGSKYAELHEWTLNLETRQANVSVVGKRAVLPIDSKLNVRPLAEEVAQLIVNHVEDERLKWNKDNTVRVYIGDVIPATNKQTTAGRRKRFRKALDELLSVSGWKPKRPNVYERIEEEQ